MGGLKPNFSSLCAQLSWPACVVMVAVGWRRDPANRTVPQTKSMKKKCGFRTLLCLLAPMLFLHHTFGNVYILMHSQETSSWRRPSAHLFQACVWRDRYTEPHSCSFSSDTALVGPRREAPCSSS